MSRTDPRARGGTGSPPAKGGSTPPRRSSAGQSGSRDSREETERLRSRIGEQGRCPGGHGGADAALKQGPEAAAAWKTSQSTGRRQPGSSRRGFGPGSRADAFRPGSRRLAGQGSGTCVPGSSTRHPGGGPTRGPQSLGDGQSNSIYAARGTGSTTEPRRHPAGSGPDHDARGPKWRPRAAPGSSTVFFGPRSMARGDSVFADDLGRPAGIWWPRRRLLEGPKPSVHRNKRPAQGRPGQARRRRRAGARPG